MFSFAHLLCLVITVGASPLPSHVLQHSRSSAPNGFALIGAAPPEQQMTFRVALKSNNISGLEARLTSISNPRSATYGQWLSADDITTHMKPSQESIAAFNAFASVHGLNTTAAGGHGEWMSFTTNVSHANSLFAASFQQFQHESAAAPIARTLSYSLPLAIADHVDTVYPTTTFGRPIAPRQGPSVIGSLTKRQQATNFNITPSSLQKLYNIPASAKDPAGISILITGYANEIPQAADTAAFITQFRPDLDPNTPVNVIPLDGGLNTQSLPNAKVGDDDEANLDVQTVLGVAAGIPTSFLSVGGVRLVSDYAHGLFDTTTFLSTTANPPSVVTTSYGLDENDFSSQDLQKICSGYMAAGARGISVIFSSGDNGVHERAKSASCSDSTFVAEFPASCPYVTTVGATQGTPETVAPFSAGGFSNIFSRPAYQDTAVNGFLSTIPANFSGVFNRTGRAYPDVAMQGVNYTSINGGALGHPSGTSASAPAFASLIALLNAQLVSSGHTTLGFLNPFLYSMAGPMGAFNDVTVGSNTGVGLPHNLECNAATTPAFTAAPGWDATTGWGSADFVRLLQAAQQAPNRAASASASAEIKMMPRAYLSVLLTIACTLMVA